jgi:hypothetical protein
MELDQALGLDCIRKEVFHEYEKWGGGVRAEKTVYLKWMIKLIVSCAVPMSTVATSAMSLAVNLEPIWSTCKKDAL